MCAQLKHAHAVLRHFRACPPHSSLISRSHKWHCVADRFYLVLHLSSAVSGISSVMLSSDASVSSSCSGLLGASLSVECSSCGLSYTIGASSSLISFVFMKLDEHHINLQFVFRGQLLECGEPTSDHHFGGCFGAYSRLPRQGFSYPAMHTCRVRLQVNDFSLSLQCEVDTSQYSIKLSQVDVLVFVHQSKPGCIFLKFIAGILPVCRDAVDVFYSSSRLGCLKNSFDFS